MQWYQKFEYAIGHWLQKATEHVLGCVLCSPGCFSLFRGWAVMDDNVMRTYTTLPSLPQVNNIHPLLSKTENYVVGTSALTRNSKEL